jgi:DNA helicase-2/ATP-dependent DNA helicase PcrA
MTTPLTDPLAGLNPAQRQAVTAPVGPVLVLAGPGSGKTRVLTHRIAHLIREIGVRPSEIAAVTFTNKAAREMASRVAALLGGGATRQGRVNLGTFHALCARMLRREGDRIPVGRNFVIFDDDDQLSLVRQAVKDLNLDPRQYSPGKIHAAISAAKNELIEAAHYSASSYFGEIVRRAYDLYDRALIANRALDFDDLLLWTVRLLRDQPDVRARYRETFRHILVDEFQDTNTAQYSLLRLLAPAQSVPAASGENHAGSGEAPAENPRDLFVVGDADQSIYRWRGADYRNVHRFQEDYPSAPQILLEQNYRSTQAILDAAMGVIDRLPGRARKRLFTDRGRGLPVTLHEAYDETDEAAYVIETLAGLVGQDEIEPRDAAVMYRTNAQSRVLEEAFLRASLPYRLVGAQRFYGRREVKDILAYLRLILNPADQMSLLRVLNVPPRGLGTKTLEALSKAASGAGIPPGEVVLDLARGSESPHGLSLSAKAAAVLGDFGRRLKSWIEEREAMSVVELIDRVVQDVGYRPYIDDGTEDGAGRWENVQELRSVAAEFADQDLAGFLEQVALVSDQDTLTDSVNAPTLLTLHAAKGLEFRVVFLIGLDDGVLPHQRSIDSGDAEAMGEERRLFYVGITRAKDRLYLVRAFRRRIFGTSGVTDPCRFLDDVPADVIEGALTPSHDRQEAIFRRQTRWDPSPAAIESRFRAGMRVVHPTFGEGVVTQSRLDRDEEEVTVEFGNAGVKHLAASIARLEILEG